MAMADYDNATRRASSLDIPNRSRVDAVDEQCPRTKATDMSAKDAIRQKLSEAFTPESLDVVDESHLHEGHAGHKPGGETHFRVNIVSPAFAGKSRLDRHRMINATLAAELAGTVHALAIKAQAPGENG
jgi:BolA protein